MRYPDNLPDRLLTFTIKLLYAAAPLMYIGSLFVVVLLVWMLGGCASPTTPLQVPNELLVRCPNLTPMDKGTAGEVVWKIVEVAGSYYNCQARMDALIDAVTQPASAQAAPRMP